MQVIYKSVLAFKTCQAVFRSHSSGALPVLAITGLNSLNSLSVRVLYIVSMASECLALDQIGGPDVFGPLCL